MISQSYETRKYTSTPPDNFNHLKNFLYLTLRILMDLIKYVVKIFSCAYLLIYWYGIITYSIMYSLSVILGINLMNIYYWCKYDKPNEKKKKKMIKPLIRY